MLDTDSKPQVLLVDDSVDVHRLVKARLRSEPVDLISATSGAEALALAASAAPALILLDLDMPVLDGFEVLRRLKGDGATHNIPVIIISGMNNSADKVTAFDLGAVDYLIKPVDFPELKARMRSALRTQQLMVMLAERAEIDGLTGLSNRQQFNKRWEQEFSAHQRYGAPLSLLMLDIDHFKKVNDTYGHPAGDEVLQGFAKIIRKCIRTTDVACRFGGEEFAVIMPHTPANDGGVVAERIRSALLEAVWPRHNDHRITVSIGCGGASGMIQGLSAEAWVEFCDQALYAAKRGGRDRVVHADMRAGAAPSRGPAALAG
ncbi:diguanylate cyclase [soil metagenome]